MREKPNRLMTAAEMRELEKLGEMSSDIKNQRAMQLLEEHAVPPVNGLGEKMSRRGLNCRIIIA